MKTGFVARLSRFVVMIMFLRSSHPAMCHASLKCPAIRGRDRSAVARRQSSTNERVSRAIAFSLLPMDERVSLALPPGPATCQVAEVTWD